MKLHRRAIAATAIFATLTSACHSAPRAPRSALGDDAITVGSFDFPESVLLGEIYSQALEARGFKVVRNLNLGPRELVDPALSEGLIELVPEYEGSALEFLGGTPLPDPHATWDRLLASAGARGIVALDPARAMDRNGFAMTSDEASGLGVKDLSDLRSHAGSLVFGGPPECPQRPLCLAGLQDRYGLRFERFVALDAGGPLTVRSLHTGLVDVALLFTSDPSLTQGLVLLRDDLGLEPAENVTPMVRADTLQRFGPGLPNALKDVSGRLTTADLQRMNLAVANGEPASSVALSWLASIGIG